MSGRICVLPVAAAGVLRRRRRRAAALRLTTRGRGLTRSSQRRRFLLRLDGADVEDAGEVAYSPGAQAQT